VKKLVVFSSLLFAACSLLAAGCEGDSDSQASGTGALSEDQFVAALASATCDGLEHCCVADGFPYNRDRCYRAVAEQVRYDVPDEYRHLFTYDAEAAGRCVEATREGTRNCKAPREMEACSLVYNGTTPPGEPCEFWNECERPAGGSSFCGPGAMDICTVSTRGRAGDTCDSTCIEHEDGSSFCFGNARPAEITMAQCYLKDGLYCSLGTCQPLLAQGEVCDNEHACAPTGRCDGVCKPAGAQGEACNWLVDCEKGLYCDRAIGTCEREKASGEPCSVDPNERECGSGYCSGGVCAPPYPFGMDRCNGDG
jgi:hypothetical protein